MLLRNCVADIKPEPRQIPKRTVGLSLFFFGTLNSPTLNPQPLAGRGRAPASHRRATKYPTPLAQGGVALTKPRPPSIGQHQICISQNAYQLKRFPRLRHFEPHPAKVCAHFSRLITAHILNPHTSVVFLSFSSRSKIVAFFCTFLLHNLCNLV